MRVWVGLEGGMRRIGAIKEKYREIVVQRRKQQSKNQAKNETYVQA